MNSSGLPVYTAPVEMMKHGFRSLEQHTQVCHPVEVIQRSGINTAKAGKLDMIRRTYGSHMAMTLATEGALFDTPHRLPGLASSKIHRDILNGQESSITFEEVLSDPQMKPDIPKVTLHDVMEVRYGIL